jgi:hypothetical protein
MLDVFNTPHLPHHSFPHFFSSAMSQYNPSLALSRSSIRPVPSTRSEPVGADRDSPEPNPNATRRSEEPEDRCVSNRSHSLRYLHHIRFNKACRQKGRWINLAISFGIDLQDIFKLGIRSDTQNLDNVEEYRNMNCLDTTALGRCKAS